MKIKKFTLPAYWASALVNADYSGLKDSEVKEINEWVRKTREPGHNLYCLGTDGNEWFKQRNDANDTAGSVLRFSFDVSPLTKRYYVQD